MVGLSPTTVGMSGHMSEPPTTTTVVAHCDESTVAAATGTAAGTR